MNARPTGESGGTGPDPREQWRDRARGDLILWTDYVPVLHLLSKANPGLANLPKVIDGRPTQSLHNQTERKKKNILKKNVRMYIACEARIKTPVYPPPSSSPP